VDFGCLSDTIAISYVPKDGVNQWEWYYDSGASSTLVSPHIIEHIFAPTTVQHIVSNGFCTDTVSTAINLNNALKASFQGPEFVCPKAEASFTNTSVGNIISTLWDFGDGTSSNQTSPQGHVFPNTQTEHTYNVSLVVENNFLCFDTLTLPVTRLQSCYITVPNAFTPNGDGRNDYLYPLNAYKATNLEFMVFNRYGQLVFETQDWTHKWDGTFNGVPQEVGTYVWTLRYTDGESGRQFFLKGTSVLIR
jgi:gliding motility-associated-like protein